MEFIHLYHNTVVSYFEIKCVCIKELDWMDNYKENRPLTGIYPSRSFSILTVSIVEQQVLVDR